ncbi:hypothetical protein GIB67_033314 [Kingdonia uniflora]|uniref:Uncharacterized protein n=1 Tax=Kingdonia uniflora TaxID=39325 RepID=A0A7J7N7I7_9MAGN|nr:hypothetical protein GIB67_033314 [Kingdonia uniflora]
MRSSISFQWNYETDDDNGACTISHVPECNPLTSAYDILNFLFERVSWLLPGKYVDECCDIKFYINHHLYTNPNLMGEVKLKELMEEVELQGSVVDGIEGLRKRVNTLVSFLEQIEVEKLEKKSKRPKLESKIASEEEEEDLVDDPRPSVQEQPNEFSIMSTANLFVSIQLLLLFLQCFNALNRKNIMFCSLMLLGMKNTKIVILGFILFNPSFKCSLTGVEKISAQTANEAESQAIWRGL